MRWESVACLAVLTLAVPNAHAQSEMTGKSARSDRIDISTMSLDGICAVRDDFRDVLGRLEGTDERTSYLRRIENYSVELTVVSEEEIEVWVRPMPQEKDEISSGGDATYTIERRTGRISKRVLGE